MAGSALTAVMVVGFLAAVAGNTIRCSSRRVVEVCTRPGGRGMAGSALTAVVVGGFLAAVAGYTIRRTCR